MRGAARLGAGPGLRLPSNAGGTFCDLPGGAVSAILIRPRQGVAPVPSTHDSVADATQKQAHWRLLQELDRTPLRLSVIRSCFQAGVPLNATDPAYGQTALMRASWSGQVDVVRFLLRLGADPNDVGEFGDSALCEAAIGGSQTAPQCIRLLLDHGADIDKINETWRRTWTALMGAAAHGHIDALRTLMARGANIGLTTREGDTALHLAVRDWRIDAMRVLLEGGADPLAANAKSQTALDIMDTAHPDFLESLVIPDSHHKAEAMRAALEDSLMRFWTAARRESLLKSLGADRAARLLPRCMAAQAVRGAAQDWQRPAARTLARCSP